MAGQTLRVAWKQSSGREARRALVSSLRELDVDATVVDEAEVVISELVSNSVRHAKPLADGTIRLGWTVRAGVVEVEVTDGGGPTVPRPAPRSLLAVQGRGLRIVRGYAHEWGVHEDRAGRTVWVSLGGPSRRRSQ
ncbi:MAG: ATP-binding protein [Dermatophilaceae bacterium]|nr:ATP-binding protein [Dermatophilaceae bacterium]